MESDLQIIIEFLERCGPEVQGHNVAEPDTREAALLLRVAAGQCTDEERAEVYSMLREHKPWLHWISNRIKSMRFDPPSDGFQDTHSKS